MTGRGNFGRGRGGGRGGQANTGMQRQGNFKIKKHL
jgi:hypothetical protein